MSQPIIGVLGGSGLYDIKELENVEEVRLETPFGDPSDAYITGEYAGKKLVFLPRHGRGHVVMPSDVNYRANIYGFKKLGVQWIISISAVGSMRKEIEPGHIVIIDQLFDRTKNRESTFFGDGIVGHIQFADPMCADLSDILYASAKEVGAVVHKGGTYVCMEGPAFSTRAESRIYRSFGVDVIGMTNIPESKLAREAGICYGTVALSTDYDCWHEEEDDVSVEAVVAIMHKNVETARRIIKTAVDKIGAERTCGCKDASKHAILTAPDAVNPETRKKLAVILGEE